MKELPTRFNPGHCLPRVALALLIGSLALACATPIGVRHVSAREVHRTLTANVLSNGEPSADSIQLLNREFLFERFEAEPEAAIDVLHERFRETGEADFLFALAELSFHRAEQAGSRERFIAASVYAYAFLFSEQPVTARNLFDHRYRLAADLYNRGLAEGLAAESGQRVELAGGSRALPFGTLAIAVDDAGFHWGGFRLTDFVPAAEYEVRGMRNRYRRSGLGAPLVASLERDTEASPEKRRWIPPRLKVPVTALLRIETPWRGLREGRLHATLELYAADASDEVEIAGRSVPLEYEPSSSLAYSLEGAAVWDFELSGFFSSEISPFAAPVDTDVLEQNGLFMMQPYRPGLIPVVLVHGTASSPARWAEMMNELVADPGIRSRFQLWFFSYNTGNPIAYSGALLREALREAVDSLDPNGSDPALRRMVVIGHSQGGLLTKLAVIDSGDLFWNNISSSPLEELEVEPETADLLRRGLFVKPVPAVTRVVFIATPHRGSFLAERRLGKLVSYFITRPSEIAKGVQDLVNHNADRVALRSFDQVPSSVDNMDPSNPFMRTLAGIPIADGVQAHSIIPVLDGPIEQGNDGVVAYASAHLEDVSERIVRSGHSTQAHPQTIAEVRRILLEHAAAE